MADDGSTKTSGTCASCQVSTRNRCTGCLDAPLYDDYIPKPSYYCSPACQKAGWGQHKSVCRALQARKHLFRAAQLLRAITYQIRLHASPLRFKSVRLDGSDVILEQDNIFYDGEERQLQRFPACLEDNRSLFEAVLVFGSCTEAMMYLHGFAKELLIELCLSIEEVSVTLTEPKLQICLPVLEGQRLVRPSQHFHNVYRITLKNGEVWAVDATGAQFGYVDPLYPWHDFEQRRLGKIEAEYAFGRVRFKTYQYLGLSPLRNMVARKIELEELTEALEDKIPALAAEFGPKLHIVLRGSDAAFQQAKDKFLNQLDNEIISIMTEMYTPAQIMRRNKEVGCQLSKNMADPEGRKQLEVMMRRMGLASAAAAQ